MEPHSLQPSIERSPHPSALRRVLGFMSVATMLMTIPQVLTIWLRHEAAGVSVISWSAYLVSAALWGGGGARLRGRRVAPLPRPRGSVVGEGTAAAPPQLLPAVRRLAGARR